MPFDAINGVALNDAERRWNVEKSSTFRAGVSVQRTKNQQPGRHGYSSVPGVDEATAHRLAVICPPSDYEALAALVSARVVVLQDTAAGLEMVADLASYSEKPRIAPGQKYVVFDALFDIPGVYARAVEATTDPAAISSSSITVEAFEGISGVISDSIIRVKGGATGLRVTDSGGTWFEYEAVLATTGWLRFDSDSGRAWKTTSDTWEGGVEVTGSIEYGPGDYPLLLTPSFTDPEERVVELTVTSTARSGSPAIEVRGRNAHRV